MERELLDRAITAIHAIYKAVGTPGDYGYDTPTGEALKGLYDLNNEIDRFLRSNRAEAGG